MLSTKLLAVQLYIHVLANYNVTIIRACIVVFYITSRYIVGNTSATTYPNNASKYQLTIIIIIVIRRKWANHYPLVVW